MTAPTRTLIVSCVQPAFVATPTTKAAMLKAALDAHASPEILDLLHGLPARNYGSVRELWSVLPQLPVE